MTLTRTELGEVIDNAIAYEEVVCFTYLKQGLPMQRTVSPYEFAEDGETFLGFDHARAALRRFDMGKIMEIETADEDYVYPIEKE